MGWRSGAAFVRTALLKIKIAQSRQRVRHKLRLLLLRYPEDDFDEALRDRGCKVGSVGTAGGNPLLHNVDNCAVQALLCIVSSGVGGLPSGMAFSRSF